MDCNFKQKKSNKKKEWEKNFNKTWNKLSVGQQMAIVIEVDGKDHAKFNT